MKADIKTEAEVIASLQKLLDAFTNRDMDSALSLFAQDPDVVFDGTGGDEKCVGLAEIKAEFERAWSQSESASIEIKWSSVSAAGAVAWVAADAIIRAEVGGQEITFPIRLTTVFEKRQDKWYVMQSHDSMPASGQAEGESWPKQPP